MIPFGNGIGYNCGLFLMMISRLLRPVTLLVFLSANAALQAQQATPAQKAGVTPNKDYGTMHLSTKIGSCKFIDGVGRLEVSFSGSMLLNQFKGKYTVSGNLVRQYNSPEHGRELYYGRGKIVFIGSFRGLQWFGRDFSAVWYGRGTVRLSGEYYESATKPGTFESGWFWYNDPAKRTPWPASGSFEQRNPAWTPNTPAPVQPRRRQEIAPVQPNNKS